MEEMRAREEGHPIHPKTPRGSGRGGSGEEEELRRVEGRERERRVGKQVLELFTPRPRPQDLQDLPRADNTALS